MDVPRRVEDLLRELAPQVLGTLARRSGDFAAAEDAVQEALLVAAAHWSRDGVPENPRGWLLQTATRRLIDLKRSEASRRARELAAQQEPVPGAAPDRDDTLTVLFMCCHPTLTPASAIALTLRAVGGLTTAEIASAFLVSEATMATRVARAKGRIKASGVPFSMPSDDELTARLRSVLRVLYLVFNEGYASSGGTELQRTDLADEAIRLARMLHRLLPDDGEVAGLLALMLLVDARRPARTSVTSEPVPLADQDRSLWTHERIVEGTALLDDAIARGSVGEYQIQAAIAAVHDGARTADETDWPQILALYGLLEGLTSNPVVTLNRAVATAMAHTPAEGLAVVDSVAEQLDGHYRVDAVRAYLFELSGDGERACAHYRVAAARTTNLAERGSLSAQVARLSSGG